MALPLATPAQIQAFVLVCSKLLYVMQDPQEAGPRGKRGAIRHFRRSVQVQAGPDGFHSQLQILPAGEVRHSFTDSAHVKVPVPPAFSLYNDTGALVAPQDAWSHVLDPHVEYVMVSHQGGLLVPCWKLTNKTDKGRRSLMVPKAVKNLQEHAVRHAHTQSRTRARTRAHTHARAHTHTHSCMLSQSPC